MTRRNWNAVAAAGLDVAGTLNDTESAPTSDGVGEALSAAPGAVVDVRGVSSTSTSSPTGGELTDQGGVAAGSPVPDEPGNTSDDQADTTDDRTDADPQPASDERDVPKPVAKKARTAKASSSGETSDTSAAATSAEAGELRRPITQARRNAPQSLKYNFTVDAELMERAETDRTRLGSLSWGEYFLQLLAWHAHRIDDIVDDSPFDLTSLGVGVVPRRGYRRREHRPAVLAVYLPRGEVGQQLAELIEDLASRTRSRSAFAEQLIRFHLDQQSETSSGR